MSNPARAVLRQADSAFESRLPPGVKPLPRPTAIGRAVELAFLRWEKRQLAPTERFWRDFGLHIVSSSSDRIVARGTGPAPCIAVATRGPRDRFIGPAFRMSDDTQLDAYVRDIEDEVLAGHLMTHGAELARLRRMSVRLQRLLVPEPSAMLRLLANPPAWVSARDVQRLQQAHDEFAVVLRDIGSLQERIKLLQDESSARVAEENNRSLFVLTMVTVLALPINLTSGLMGMNVGGVPWGQDPHGFWWMVLLIGSITVALAWVAIRWWGRSKRGQ